jgi:hypothetical protein
VEVEWLILADSAQVIGNKLYVLGGGWDTLNVAAGFPVQQQFALALSVRVPWNETNQKHAVEVEGLGEQPSTEEPKSLFKVNGQFEVGRPAGIRPGQDQRIQLAIGVNLKLEAPGTNIIVARIEGQEMRRVHFNVMDRSSVAQRREGS